MEARMTERGGTSREGHTANRRRGWIRKLRSTANQRAEGTATLITTIAVIVALIGGAGPAAADVLVSNLGAANAGSGDEHKLSVNDFAQSFTTGTNASGYQLESISITFVAAGSRTHDPVYVSVHPDEGNNPPEYSNQLATLTKNGATFEGPVAGVNKYKVWKARCYPQPPHGGGCISDASSVHLDANTRYWVYIWAGEEATTARLRLALGPPDMAAAGWSLSNSVMTKPEGTADSNWASLGVPMKIQVEGYANPEVLISISDATATEGVDETADFVVTLNRKSSGTVTVDYITLFTVSATPGVDYQNVNGTGAALLRRGVFALFMGLFARGCVSPVLISGGQQPSQRVPASFRRPAEPRNGAEHRRSVPLGRAPFWTFTRRSGTVPWEGRQACDGCDDRIPATYIRRAANRRPLHRSPEPSPVRSGRCCLRGCQSPPLVQRSPADERERTRTGTAPAGPGFGTQAPARTSRPTQPERGCWSGRGHQRCRVLRAARARKPRRNGLRHDAGCGSGLRAARSRRLASARCRAEPAAGALLGRDAPPRDHRDRLAGTTAYALEATVVLDIIHVAAATRRAVLVAGSSKGLSAFGPRPDGSRPARGDTWLQLRRSSAAAGSRSLDAY